MDAEKLLTPDDVATLLGCSGLFVIRKTSSGKLPGIKVGRSWRFRASALQAWLDSQEQQTA